MKLRNLWRRLFGSWYQVFLASMPDEATADVSSFDLKTENFDTAHFELPNGYVIDLYRKA